MVFSSLTFLLFFLPASLLLYYVVPFKAKNYILVLVSLVFYAWGEPVYVVLMIYSILLNYVMGRLMERVPEHKKAVLVFAIVLNLLVLGFFKYYGFLANSLNEVLPFKIPVRELALPIGISFYTFQALSYLIDLYRGKFGAQKNLIRFAAYISMFPQLIAGPIVRYEDVEKQLSEREITFARFGKGMLRFVFGLGKKVLLANTAGTVFETARSLSQTTVLSAWIGTIGYTFQIYFDFSGYSDMAIGLGEMLGFEFAENFDYPYLAHSVSDFWRRWHISLGTWFREYVYIPLGGNRVKAGRQIFNLLVVWILTGLWHGAGYTFMLWGLYYGILIILDKFAFGRIKIPKAIGIIFTLFFVMLGWVLFSSDTIGEAWLTYKAMFGFGAGLWDQAALYTLLRFGILLVVEAVLCLPILKDFYGVLSRHLAGRVLVYVFALAVLALSLVFLVTDNYNPFLYFRF